MPAGVVTASSSSGLVPMQASIQNLARVRPSGDLSSGVPAQNYAPGQYDFRSNIQVLGADPTVNAAAFGATLARTVSEIMGGAANVNASSARIVRGTRQTQGVRRSGIAGAVPILNLTDRDVPTWWLTVEGRVNGTSPWTLNGQLGLNRAIARAVAQVTRLTRVDDAYTIPPDGGELDAMFRADGACSGHRDYSKVYAAACTRVQPVIASATPPAPAPTTGPVMTPIPPPAPTGGSAPATGPTCAIRIQSVMWLRPTATFDHVGPQIPAGTPVTVTGPKVQDRGSLALYPVLVNGQRGYGALSAADFLGCTTFPGPGGAGSGGSTAVAPRPPSPSPVPGAPPLMLNNSLSGGASSTGTSMVALGVGAGVLTLLGVAAYVKRKEIKAMLSGTHAPAHGHAKHNGRRARRRRASH